MEFWSAVRVVLRRWYLVVPCLIVVAVVAATIVGRVPPSYRAAGSVVALRDMQPEVPDTPDTTTPINPWQTADYSTNLFAILMAQAATDQSFQDALATAGASPTFTVTGPVDQSATLQIEVKAASPEEAMRSYGLLVDALRQDAERRQESAGAPRVTWVSLVDMTVPIRAERQSSQKVVALILIVVIGLFGTVASAFVADAVAGARRRRRSGPARRSGNDGDDGAGAPPVGPTVGEERRVPAATGLRLDRLDGRPLLLVDDIARPPVVTNGSPRRSSVDPS